MSPSHTAPAKPGWADSSWNAASSDHGGGDDDDDDDDEATRKFKWSPTWSSRLEHVCPNGCDSTWRYLPQHQ
jgi:hypothetical protein